MRRDFEHEERRRGARVRRGGERGPLIRFTLRVNHPLPRPRVGRGGRAQTRFDHRADRANEVTGVRGTARCKKRKRCGSPHLASPIAPKRCDGRGSPIGGRVRCGARALRQRGRGGGGHGALTPPSPIRRAEWERGHPDVASRCGRRMRGCAGLTGWGARMRRSDDGGRRRERKRPTPDDVEDACVCLSTRRCRERAMREPSPGLSHRTEAVRRER